jgi:hypothetical protein
LDDFAEKEGVHPVYDDPTLKEDENEATDLAAAVQ